MRYLTRFGQNDGSQQCLAYPLDVLYLVSSEKTLMVRWLDPAFTFFNKFFCWNSE